jgi:hypothetical protein
MKPRTRRGFLYGLKISAWPEHGLLRKEPNKQGKNVIVLPSLCVPGVYQLKRPEGRSADSRIEYGGPGRTRTSDQGIMSRCLPNLRKTPPKSAALKLLIPSLSSAVEFDQIRSDLLSLR